MDTAPVQSLAPKMPVKSSQRIFLVLLIYLFLISVAEYLTLIISTVYLGLFIHSLILIVLLLHAGFITRRYEQRLYLALAFAPLIRLVSLSLPLRDVPRMYWYVIVGAPLFLAAWLAARSAGINSRQVGLTLHHFRFQLFFSFVGIVLGYLEYFILRPQPLAPAISLQYLWVPALILLVFTGLLEELIFRGLMQTAFLQGLGRWRGLLYGSTLFAVLHLGYRSVLDVLFAFGVALLFSLFVLRTGSIFGVTLAHGLTNVTLFLVFPFWIGLPPFAQTHQAGITQPPVLASPTTLSTIIENRNDLPSLVVDDGDRGFSRRGGQAWEAIQGQDGDLVWSLNSRDSSRAIIVWTASLEVCGLYQVDAYIPEDYATTQSQAYRILSRDGEQVVEINQAEAQGEWALLGHYWFDPARPARVIADNRTGETDFMTFVAFDSIRWTLMERCP
jgi:membrane protease YdiL (CAAX protease family)